MILIVDDHRDGAEALCRLLALEGYSCRVVESGYDALVAIRAHPPEQPLLVVLDNMMPELTGVQTLRLIRADKAINRTPVVIYSASFDADDRDEAIVLGAAAWLLKGGGVDGVRMIINSIVRWYRSAGGVAMPNPQ